MSHAPGAIWAERALTPDGLASRVRVRLAGGCIAALEIGVEPAAGDAVHRGATLLPGLVDLQVNGAAGAAFSDADGAARRRIVDWHLRRGTTSLVATLISAGPDELVSRRCSASTSRGRSSPRPRPARIPSRSCAMRRRSWSTGCSRRRAGRCAC
jgi:N-acetylglucosamine-6-phosphate deacetylase